ncbi:hypothetical protein GCM10009623_27880 [Nocardioides aestuarii]|uniref:hypothetical protein n=1 Tax=Nocardioides aestuarii TaxID=252231 RepID=UPI0031D660A0
MGDGFTAAATSVGVLLTVVLVVLLLLAAWRHRRRSVVRAPRDLDLDLATGARVVGAVTRRRTGHGIVDSHQGQRLLAAVSEEAGPGPATVLVLAPGGTGPAEDVAAALAAAADGGGEPVTLVHAPGGARRAVAPRSVREYQPAADWLGTDASLREARVDDFLEELETEDDGTRTVVLAAPPIGDSVEALAMAPFVDVALVVAERGVTTLAELDRTVEDLAGAGADLVLVAVLETSGPAVRTDHASTLGIALAVVLTTGLLALVPTLLDHDSDAGAGAGAVPTDGRPAAGAVRDETGPGRDRPGVHLTAAADSDGDLRVVEQVVSTEPLRSVRVAPPPPPEGSTTAPQLTDVRISADGERVPFAAGTIGEGGVAVRLPGGATRLELTYRVTGAGFHSDAAPAGRTSFSLRPATERTVSDLRVVTEVRGEGVLGVVCPEVPQAQRLCGVEGGRGWRTRPVPVSQSAVVALVDLAPGGPVDG